MVERVHDVPDLRATNGQRLDAVHGDQITSGFTLLAENSLKEEGKYLGNQAENYLRSQNSNMEGQIVIRNER